MRFGLIEEKNGKKKYMAAVPGGHAVLPVTRGVRFACLPFVFDEAAVRQKSASVHPPVTIAG